MAVAYINREGGRISGEDWKKLSADPSYVCVRRYDNGVVRVELNWNGRVANYGSVFPDFYKVFILSVKNYNGDGQLVPDPVSDGQAFPNEAAAVAFYEEFLTQWTDSGVDAFGDFQEADNVLAPPPPPDPNRPETEPDDPELGGVGAW